MPKYNEVTFEGVRYESESAMCQSLGLNRQSYDSVKRRFKGNQKKAIEHMLRGKKKQVIVKDEEVVEKIIRDTGKDRFEKEGPRESDDIMEDYDFD